MKAQIKGSLVLLVAFLQVSAQADETQEVFGLLNHSVQLSNPLPQIGSIEEIIWTFTSQGKTVKVASIKYGQLNKYAIQFSERIKILNNGEILVIEHLSMRDSGIYTIDITLISKETYEQPLVLFVYEPVPVPSIRAELGKRTKGWCNMTIYCSVSTNSSAVSYIWKYRHGDIDYHLYNKTGDTIQMSLQPESWDMDLMCIVHNPADRKNATLNVQPTCAPGCSIHLRLGLTAAYILLSIFFIYLSHRYRYKDPSLVSINY
ncbi:SLAM family member 5-like [Pyxicephalus adspersus]|uniref:SLAM family member 5-like n=1 Tax=Pyxicephalus adspersus TaxID=30357 RepID=UPI003B5C29C1